MTIPELNARLLMRGVISEAETLRVEPIPESAPWFSQVVLGFCAWLASLFLLAFIALAIATTHLGERGMFELLLFGGAAGCLGAGAIYATAGDRNPFLAQFALAISCAGQFAIAFGIGGLTDARVACWSMVALEIGLVVAMKHRLHRFLSALAATMAWAIAMRALLVNDLPGAAAQQGNGLVVSGILWILVWAPVTFGAVWLVQREARWMSLGRELILRPAAEGLIAAIAIAPLVLFPALFWREFGSTRTQSEWIALWPFLGALLSLLSLDLAFAIRNRALMGLAILFGLLEISSFYYVLGATLLIKSVLMIALGAGLLAASWQAEKVWK